MDAAANSGPGQAIRDGTPGRVADQLGQWVGHLSRNAAVQWSGAFVGRKACSFCEAEAIATCIGCGDPVCIGHGYVSHRAELLCDECVGNLVESEPSSPEQAAFLFFHLTKDATLEEVKAAYRLRSQTAHPDRGGTTRAMQETTMHFEVLKQHFERGGF